MSAWDWLFGRRRAEEELAREIDAHIAERADDLMDEGLDEDNARAQARREFGNRTLPIERSREVWIAPWLSSLRQDLWYAMRSLIRQPGFTASAIIVLALGVGPVTTLFSLVNGALLRPWPVRDPSAVAIVRPIPGPKEQYGSLSNIEYRYLREHTRSFTQLSAWVPGGGPVAYGQTKINVQSSFVSANYFEMLGVGMHLGRTFLPDEEDYTSPRAVAIISERLWREYFGAPAGIVGETILVYDRPFTVVGVAQAGFFDVDRLRRVDLWMPRPSLAIMSFANRAATLKSFADPRAGGVEQVAGRLAPGVSRATAQAELTLLSRQFRQAIPMDTHGYTLPDTRPISIGNSFVARQLSTLQLAGAALLLVMLLACANVGNLLLARGLSRQREIAIRVSLGASRMRVVRQLMTEVFLLTLAASGVGLAIGVICLRVVAAQSPSLHVNPNLSVPDLTACVVTLVSAFLACLAAGVMPALRSTKVTLAARAGDTVAGRGGAGRLRTTLLATQLALSMILLVGAGLLTRAVGHAMSLDLGFDIHEVQVLSLSLPEGAAPSRFATLRRTLGAALDAGEFPPAAFSEFTAITSSYRNVPFRRHDATGAPRAILARDVSGGYFAALGIPFVSGRSFANEEQTEEVVVNESAARVFWPEGDAVGQRLTSGSSDAVKVSTVVGIVKDVPVMSLAEVQPVVYVPLRSGRLLLVRDRSTAIVERIASVARGIEPDVKISARPLSDDVKAAAGSAAYASKFAWAIALLALMLATVGAFGVFAYAVEERRREIGVRMALGAHTRQVVWTVISGARRALIAGLVAGVLLSSIAAPLLRRLLYGLSPFDPITYAGVTAILVASALAATWIPARHAARIDPAITLRGD